MYIFKAETKIEERIPTTKTITSITELAQEFDDIHNSSDGSIGFWPTPMFSDIETFWFRKDSKKKGLFSKRLVKYYYIELNFKSSDGSSGFSGYNTLDFNEVKDMLANLILCQKLPDTSNWTTAVKYANGKGDAFIGPYPHSK